ncbi:secreted phosphoprotein 24 [Globicephala melas]|uniref:secreted phosphoprotein 24 n=1 Tax=Globicephala melas TaxID=9731 RepID=UPI00293D2749|nr:secreted phosphoprotein 24 [Globicephala melas]
MILPRTEKMVMKVLITFVLGTNYWFHYCAGFPVYDYDPSSLREAVSASVAKVNSQSLSPYLFRAFRSSVRRVNILDEDSLTMDIELRIRETTCRRGSGEDPATCDFQRGYYVPAVACRSTVWVSAEQVQDVRVRCQWSSSSSESNSSEEMVLGDILGSSTSRNSYLLGITRRGFPPGNRRGLNLWPRARINTGFE